MSQYVEHAIDDGVATITIDRAERHNSLVPALLDELVETLESIEGESSVRAVVLRTAGPSFSTGGDVRAFYDNRDRLESYANRTVGRLNDAILAIRALSQPVVAAVDGPVTGGSIGFVLAADVALATDDATMTPYYAVVGFSPDGGWTAMLPRVIGPRRTARLIMTNETIHPSQALEWGLVSEVVPADQLAHACREVAETMASMRPGAVDRTKRLLDAPIDELEARLDRERRSFVEQVVTDEAMAGMQAFLDEA